MYLRDREKWMNERYGETQSKRERKKRNSNRVGDKHICEKRSFKNLWVQNSGTRFGMIFPLLQIFECLFCKHFEHTLAKNLCWYWPKFHFCKSHKYWTNNLLAIRSHWSHPGAQIEGDQPEWDESPFHFVFWCFVSKRRTAYHHPDNI